MTDALPAGWTWVEVADLASAPEDITDGPFGSNLKTEHYTREGPRVIRLQNIGDGSFVDEKAHIAPSHFDRLQKHELKQGDVMVAMLGAHLPRACIAPPALGPAIVKADCVRLRPDSALTNSKFVSAGLNSAALRRQAEVLVHGVGRPRLGLKWFRTLRFPLAPLAEQERVVEAIDSYVTRLDDAVASLERVQAKLTAYRASILKAAVGGRLVPTEASRARAEKRDYEPAEVLLARILKERRRRWEEAELARRKAAGKVPEDDKWKAKYREPAVQDTARLPALPEGWCWANLDQLLHLLRNGQSMAPRKETGVRTLRISSVRPLAVDFQDVRYLPGEPADYQDDLVEVNDLLFTRYNGTPSLVGVCGRVRVLTEPTVHPDKLIKVRLCSDLHVPYVELAANVGESRRLIEGRTRTTAGQAGISGADLKQMPIPLPPLSEQVRIGDEVERLVSVANETKSAVAVDERRCVRLRQSTLKWAFEGKLVDQDATDEPVESLLARIRAERAAVDPIKKRRSRTGKGSA